MRDRATGAAVGTVQATIMDDHDGRAADRLGRRTQHQGHGLATEAARAVMAWLRDEGTARFAAHVHPDHAASAAVARHLGLTPGEPRADGEVRFG